MGEVTGTAEIQRLVTRNLGADLTDIDKKIAEALHKTQEEVTKLFNEAAAKNQSDYNWLSEKTGRPLDKSVISQITQAAINTAQGDLDNITGTIGFITRSGQFSLWDQAYRQALSFGSFQVASGATSYTQAAREIINQFAGKGMMIEYASGQRRTVETAVRLCITSGVGRMAKDMAEQNGQMLGADGVEISAHAGSAPDHEPYQGRQYTRADFEAIDNMLDRPFEIWNCRHIVYPVILGLSQPVYTEAELNAMAAENAKGITYDGKHYTLYEATQMQRQIERSIRGLKRELIGANAARDQELFTNKSIKLNVLRHKYVDFSAQAGLLTQNERAQIYGYGRSISAKSVSANKKAFYNEAKAFYNENVKNEPYVTGLIKEFGEKYGLEPIGLEYRIKGEGSYMRKALAEWNETGSVSNIKDILRYTYLAKPEDLAVKTNEALAAFKEAGNEIFKVKNTWHSEKNPYRGINTNIRTPDGVIFEVQYHTPESFDLKNGPLHELYEKQRVLPSYSDEFKRLNDEMFKLSDSLTVPKGIEEVKNV